MNLAFFRTPSIAELERALGLPANSVAIASRSSKGGEGKTYALAFFDHEIGKDFPDFALKNSPIGTIKATIKEAIELAKTDSDAVREGSTPRTIFWNVLAIAFFKTANQSVIASRS